LVNRPARIADAQCAGRGSTCRPWQSNHIHTFRRSRCRRTPSGVQR
jgi:hypothetical protein